ncbi:uncharacterized protein LOC62_06G008697 [Vanrija pseudolonga]|uniref:Uncharacterized protein n=1 Tax=Vanrija pseudolonga TaxID=143232 RepID=A0AAF1BTT7_9TREE|nr:hypothetical protein LOC62_06G008697 [Vanrija pseudolonga]
MKAVFLLSVGLAAAAVVPTVPTEERGLKVDAPQERGLLDGLIGGKNDNSGLLNELLGQTGGGGLLATIAPTLEQTLQQILAIPSSVVSQLVTLLDGVIANNGLPIPIPAGLAGALTDPELTAFLYNAQNALAGVPAIPSGLLSTAISTVKQIVPVAASTKRSTEPRSDPSVAGGLLNTIEAVTKILGGLNPAANVTQVVADLNQLQAAVNAILPQIPTSLSGLDTTNIADALGELLNNLATYLNKLSVASDPQVLLAGQGLLTTLATALTGLAGIPGINNVLNNLTTGVNLGGTNTLAKVLAQVVASVLQLVQGLLNGTGLGGLLSPVEGILNSLQGLGGSGATGALGGLLSGLLGGTASGGLGGLTSILGGATGGAGGVAGAVGSQLGGLTGLLGGVTGGNGLGANVGGLLGSGTGGVGGAVGGLTGGGVAGVGVPQVGQAASGLLGGLGL